MVKNLATSASKPYGRGGGARVVILRERFWRFCAQSPKAYPSTRLFPLTHPGFFDLFAFHEATACDAGDFSANVIASPSDSRQTTYWIYSTVFASALYAATETLCFVRHVLSVPSSVFCPVSSVFLSLHRTTDRYREIATTSRLHDYILGESGTATRRRIRQKIRIDINQCCRDIKQVLTPSEWFTNFRVHKADVITNVNFMLV